MSPSASPAKGAWVTSVRPPDDLVRRLEGQGWHVGVVSGAPTKAEALAAIGKALAFPSYYGKNLDALWDCLSDLTEPTALVWVAWEPLAVGSPDDWAAIGRVLRQRVDAPGAVPFSVLFSVGTPAEAG